MRGQLKSKFLVLSDDRVLPPYQGNKGKRSRPGDDDPNQASGKRQNQAGHSPLTAPVVAGVSVIQPQHGLVVPGPVPQLSQIQAGGHYCTAPPGPPAIMPISAPSFRPILSPDIQVVDQVNALGVVPQVQTGPSGAIMSFHQVQAFQGSVPQAPDISSSSFPPLPTIQGPPPQTSNATRVQAQVHGFTTVASKTTRRRNKKKDPQANPSRSTPSRAAKNKATVTNMEVTSPTKNYESCGSSNESVPDDQDIKQG